MPAEASITASAPPLDEAALQAMADQVLDVVGRADAELSVLLTTDDTIASLNAQYRGVEGPTDVLSFPQDDPTAPPGGLLGPPPLLGDVVISVQRATAQADEHGHDVVRELWVLLVHGVLHLLGHDHETEAERTRMTQEEQRILAAVGQAGGDGLIARSTS